MASRASLLWLRLGSGSSGECGRFLPGVGCSEAMEMLFPVADLFGLYEQSCGCSRLTQFSQGLLLSHFTFLCLQGQQAVPGLTSVTWSSYRVPVGRQFPCRSHSWWMRRRWMGCAPGCAPGCRKAGQLGSWGALTVANLAVRMDDAICLLRSQVLEVRGVLCF